jgi:D-alanyl-D-alanine carboxypeptidase (penicillin-binding protein 5/6)
MSQRKHRGRKLLRTSLVVLVLVLIGSYVGFAFTRPVPALALSTQLPTKTATAQTPLTWPSFGQAAVGAVGYGVLATNGDQTALPTASIIKIMTALAVLKQKPLAISEQGPTLTLDQTDVDFHTSVVAQDGSAVPVTVDEQISEYQALQAMLLPSANNIADSLARWAFGSVDAYNAYANNYAKQLGLTSMVVTDPSGLAVTTLASPQDLVTLGEIALANPVIAEIVGQTSAVIPVAGTVYNVNALLGRSGTIGIKTGNNDADLGAYLFASEQTVGTKTITIVGAIMDGPSLSAALLASLPLIQTAAQNFSQKTVIKAGQQIGEYNVPWQGKVAVAAAKDISVISWNAKPPTISRTGQQLHAPAAAGTAVGSVTVSIATTKNQTSTDLVLKQAIKKPGIIWKLKHAFD